MKMSSILANNSALVYEPKCGGMERRGLQTDKQLPQSRFTSNFFLDDDILLLVYIVN
jgi:hypothetical protein